MKQTLSVESENGSRVSVPEFLEDGSENPEWNDLWSQINDQSVITRVIAGPGVNERVVLDSGARTKHEAEQAASVVVANERQDRTVVITVDDKIMPATIETVELQKMADLQTVASVKARVVNEKGVSAAAVDVKTYAEYHGS